MTLNLPALAAINPADPGLPDAKAYGQDAIPNNGASALCVECHTENPTPMKGTHFVMNYRNDTLFRTHSGGGWDKGWWGIREGGQFFKLLPWAKELGGNGGSSKYGDAETWESVMHIREGFPVLASEACRIEVDALPVAKLEIVCESCHSLRVNVAGGNHLLAGLTDAQGPEALETDGRVSPLCVGCHGFLYHDDQGQANSLNQHWADTRTLSDITGLPRANNEVHWVGGIPYPRNHHVMSGDAIDIPLVAAKLLMRDVDVMDPRLVERPIHTDSRKGTMPIRRSVLPPMVLSKDSTGLHCLTCHKPGHGGEPSMGAAILVGEQLGGRDSGYGIDRISDGKEWGRFNDSRFCGMCHE